MSLVAEITHTDGSTETLDALRTEEEYKFERMDIASVFVDRPQINDVSLEEDDDEIEITEDGEKLFGGVLRDVLRGGGEVELLLDSYERYALDGERSSGSLAYENAPDTDVYSDAIDDIPQLSEGDVDNISDAVTFVFPYTSPAKRIRTVAENTGAEVLYPPDKTIDIVESLGLDKTEGNGETPLSPSEQNISGDFNPERQSGEKKVTHLIMLGAGEGSAQIQATVVPEDDPYDYEDEDKYANVRRYGADVWEDGDRKKWDSRTNKDLTDPDTLGDLGVTLIEEYNGEFIDVEINVEDADVMLGDEFTIRHPEEDVDMDLRAVDVTRIVDYEGRRYQTTFSNRRLTRESDEEKRIKDSERYNRAFEGSAVTMNTGGGRQPVDSSHNYEFEFYYPSEVEYEHRVRLFVKGLAYRAYSGGTAAGGGIFQSSGSGGTDDDTTEADGAIFTSTQSGGTDDDTTTNNADFENVTTSGEEGVYDSTLDDSWTDISSFTSSDNTSELYMFFSAYETDFPEGTSKQFDYRLYNEDTGEYIPDSDGFDCSIDENRRTSGFLVWAEDLVLETITLQARYVFDSSSFGADVYWLGTGEHDHSFDWEHTHDIDVSDHSHSFDWLHDHEIDVDDHTHPPEAGIIESFDGTTHYPENCDVVVNGTTIDTDLGDGSGPFEETVDLSGELNPGSINRVEVTSDSLGHIQSHLDIDVYRQILGRG